MSAAVLSMVFGAGCRTEFRGNAHFSGGPRECYARCASENMRMASFVFMGDFATGCVCELIPATRTAGAEVPEPHSGGEGIAAVAGVWQQMLEEEASR